MTKSTDVKRHFLGNAFFMPHVGSADSSPAAGRLLVGRFQSSSKPRKRRLLPWVEKLSSSPQGADD
jgi:hypothetical protein